MRSERQSDGVGYRGRCALGLTHNTHKQTKHNMTDQTRHPTYLHTTVSNERQRGARTSAARQAIKHGGSK